jgi:hypothetical protein
MASEFGSRTNHFDDLIDLAVVTGLRLIDSNAEPVPKSRADAVDHNNDIVEGTRYGGGDVEDISCQYKLVSGTLVLNTLKLGEIAAGVAVSSIGVVTSNTEWPIITVTGKKGLETMAEVGGSPAVLNTYTLPELTITAAKRAQLLGFTFAGDARLTGSSFEFSAEIAETADGLGEPCAHGISGASGAMTAEFQRIEGAPTVTLTLSGLTEIKDAGDAQPAAAYGTCTYNADIILARDTAA